MASLVRVSPPWQGTHRECALFVEAATHYPQLQSSGFLDCLPCLGTNVFGHLNGFPFQATCPVEFCPRPSSGQRHAHSNASSRRRVSPPPGLQSGRIEDHDTEQIGISSALNVPPTLAGCGCGGVKSVGVRVCDVLSNRIFKNKPTTVMCFTIFPSTMLRGLNRPSTMYRWLVQQRKLMTNRSLDLHRAALCTRVSYLT